MTTDDAVRALIASIIDAELSSGSDFAQEYKAAKAANDCDAVARLQREFIAEARRQLL